MTRTRLAAGLAVFCAVAGLPAGASAQIYRSGTPGISDPVLVRQVAPRYTREAMDAGVQGLVELEAVVLPDGTVGAVRVVRSLDTSHGLDDQAVAAARQWLFRPAELGARPVAMAVALILEFRLHNRDQGAAVSPAQERRREGAGDFPPVAVKTVTPRYTAEAMRQKLQGQVTLEAVVDASGRVVNVKVVKSLDAAYGLDDAAVAAAREWQFQPGTVDGKPAAHTITLVLEFRLH